MNYSAQETDSHFKFLANAMHEIRTPLQTILGSAELLSATTLDAEQKEYVRQIQFSSEVLLSLANDMLDVSKLRSDNFILEDLSFNVLNLLEQVDTGRPYKNPADHFKFGKKCCKIHT